MPATWQRSKSSALLDPKKPSPCVYARQSILSCTYFTLSARASKGRGISNSVTEGSSIDRIIAEYRKRFGGVKVIRSTYPAEVLFYVD